MFIEQYWSYDDTTKFLELIEPNFKVHEFLWFLQRGGHRIQRYGTIADYEILRNYNEKGWNIFVCINAIDTPVYQNGNAKREAKNVTRVRAIFIDLDDPSKPVPRFARRPSVVVSSSPGKYHCYWLTDSASKSAGGIFSPQQLHRAGVDSPFNTAARETLEPPSGKLLDGIRNVGTLAALFSGHGLSAAASASVAMALYSKPGVNMLINGLGGVVPYATLRMVGDMPPAKAMRYLSDLGKSNPEVGQALAQLVSRYGAEAASRRQMATEEQ